MDILFEDFFAGRFLNSIVVLVLTLTALLLGITIVRSKTKEKELTNFGYFWFITGWAWGTSAIRQMFSALNMLDLDMIFFMITEIFIFISGMFLAPYLFSKTFKNEYVTRAAQYFYIIGGVVGTAGFILYGSTLTSATRYATEYEPNKFTLIIVTILIAILIVVAFMKSTRELFLLAKKQTKWFTFLAPFSIFIYLLFGVVDISGIIGGWVIIIFRLVFLVAFVLAYIAFAEEAAFEDERRWGDKGQKIVEI